MGRIADRLLKEMQDAAVEYVREDLKTRGTVIPANHRKNVEESIRYVVEVVANALNTYHEMLDGESK